MLHTLSSAAVVIGALGVNVSQCSIYKKGLESNIYFKKIACGNLIIGKKFRYDLENKVVTRILSTPFPKLKVSFSKNPLTCSDCRARKMVIATFLSDGDVEN